MANTDPPTAEPNPADFASIADFAEAYDAFHDRRQPTSADALERAVRIASESLRGIDLQIRRVRGVEPEDDEWILRAWMDFQFLIVCLWRLRMAGRMIAATADEVRAAVDVFDKEVPDLAQMRHVSQHFDEYGVDGPRRRQRRPDSGGLIGRRSLEVGAWNADRIDWLGGTIDIAKARKAAAQLYAVIRETRDSAR